jgi:hypothetical protein
MKHVRLMICLILFFSGLLLVSTAIGSGGDSLGISDHAQEVESGGMSVLRVVFLSTAITLVITGIIIHHGALFTTIAIIVVAIGFAGKGVPLLLDESGLAEGATISREAPPVDHHGLDEIER